MDNNTVAPQQRTLPALRGAELCTLGQKWTCTIQCDGGTRYPVERLFNAPGVEACIVQHCQCQPVPPPPAWTLNVPPEILDAQLPIALVIFGARHLLGR